MKRVLLPLMRIGIFAFACLHFSSKVANAQVTADDTVNTQVNRTDNVSEITGGETRGDNLFHSFQEFSVGAGETASFLNSNDIANIFSRVTGGRVSNIDGLIRANGSANLFLINPAGIIFGEGASLNIGGSFYGSSADSILFENGEFRATDLDNPPVLTINAPIGLGFRDNPQDIVNQSRALDSTGQFTSGLQVLEGKNLALIGGDVRFEGGFIFAPGGRVELGGLSVAGTVDITNKGNLSFPEDVARSDISFAQEALVSVSGRRGGDIKLTAGDIQIAESSLLQGGTFADTGLADSQSGNINLNATGAINLDESTINNSVGIGDAGEITIRSTNFSLVNGLIRNSTKGQGNAGNITIDVNEKVSLDTGNIFSNILEEAEGNSGEIKISANSISLTNGAQIQSGAFEGGKGNGNNITLNATGGDVTISSSNQLSSGIFADVQTVDNFDSGNIQINAQGSILLNNAVINNTNAGTGLAGTIKLNAPNEISIKNSTVAAGGDFGLIFIGDSVRPSQITLEGERTETEDGFEFSNLVSTKNSNPDDSAGSIFIDARDRINVTGTNIEASTQTTRLDQDPDDQDQLNNNFSEISLNIDGENSQGSINIERSEIDSTNFSTGFAGFVTLDASNEISIKDSQIFAEGNFGVIAIGDSLQPSQVTLEGERTETENGFEFSNLLSTISSNPNDLAGKIRINARDRINVIGSRIQSSTETTRTTDINDEDGLNFGVIRLLVDEENLLGSIAVERSQIDSTNFSTGFAGNVVLNAREKIEISDSSIFSTGQLGRILFGASDLSGETSSPQEININNSLLTVSNKDVTVPENEDPQIDAGTISINATNDISIANNSDIRAFTERFGNAGDLTIQAENGTVSFDNSNVFSNVNAGGVGFAGDINITANSISLTNSSQLQSGIVENSDDLNQSGIGDGGKITLNAKESITLSGRNQDGKPSAIFTDVGATRYGNAGNIEINTGFLSLTDGAQLNTKFTGLLGNAGNITVNVDSLTLNNNSEITSSSIPSEKFSEAYQADFIKSFTEDNPEFSPEALKGGNVTINLQNVLKLSDGSVMDAKATGKSSGGNITINAPDGVIVAFPNQNNDITASAEQGAGGKIKIAAESVLGIEKRELNDLTNDINASSDVLGLDGTVNLNTSDINPLQGATELPSNVVEARQTSDQTCSVDRQTGTANGLTVTGRGGVHPAPDLPLTSQTIMDNGKDVASEINEAQVRAIAPVHTSQGDIIPAQGIVVTEDGRMILTAYATDGNSRVPHGSANCTGSK
jgi:filamentous hemagglutinin family protein